RSGRDGSIVRSAAALPTMPTRTIAPRSILPARPIIARNRRVQHGSYPPRKAASLARLRSKGTPRSPRLFGVVARQAEQHVDRLAVARQRQQQDVVVDISALAPMQGLAAHGDSSRRRLLVVAGHGGAGGTRNELVEESVGHLAFQLRDARADETK